MPDIPDGPPPLPTPDPVTELRNKNRQLRDAITRMGQRGVVTPGAAPLCRVRLTSSFNLSANADTYAVPSGWSTTYDGQPDDPLGMFGTTNGLASITIPPINARWDFEMRAVLLNTSSGNSYGCFITRNNTSFSASSSTTFSIARKFAGWAGSGGSDGPIPEAWRLSLPCAPGDVIYWGTWCSNASFVASSNNGVPTEIIVRFDRSLQ